MNFPYWFFYQYFRWRLSDSGCLCFSSYSISSVSGKTQFDTLFVSNFKAPFMLSLLIKILIFIEILVIVMLLSDDFNFSCILCPS